MTVEPMHSMADNEPASAMPRDHVRTRRGLRLYGRIGLFVALAVVLLGGISFVVASIANVAGLIVVGMVGIFVGIAIGQLALVFLGAGYSGKVQRYFVREGTPAAIEGVQRVTPALSRSAGVIARGVAEAVSSEQRAPACADCGAVPPEDAKFCHRCGASQNRACPTCASEQPGSAKFCGECGESMLTVNA